MKNRESSDHLASDAIIRRQLVRLLRQRYSQAGDFIDIAVSEALTACRLSSNSQQFSRARAYSIAKNAILNELRRCRNLVHLQTLDESHMASYPLDDALESRTVDGILAEQLLAELTPAQAEAVRLHLLEGYTTRELAGRFEISENAVKERLKTALRRLRRYLRAEGLESFR